MSVLLIVSDPGESRWAFATRPINRYVKRDHPRRAFGGLYHCAKFGWNRCSSFDNMHVFDFAFGLKTPIHAPKLGFMGK